jgi:uncharacterized protein YecE (DUF72 family)
VTKVLIGTCNWLDHKGFYPAELDKSTRAKEKLTYYARQFPIVEVDSTFYGIPEPDVAMGWVERTPDDFVFNVKAYRTLTGHGTREEPKRLATPGEERDFVELIKPIREAGKLGAIHYQFAPWVTHSVKAREALLEVRERHPGDRVAVEFRHKSWYQPEALAQTTELLTEADITLVAVDAPQLGSATAPPFLAITSPKLAVVRFHGRNYKTWYGKGATSADRFDYTYGADEFSAWKRRLRDVEDKVEEMHLLMNTNAGSQGPDNARLLASVLGVALPGVGGGYQGSALPG